MPTKLSHQQSLVPDVAADVATKSWVEGLSGVSNGDYIQIRKSGIQAGLTSTITTITFDTVLSSRGSLDLISNQIVGFKAGRTYAIYSDVDYDDTLGLRATYDVYDVTGAVSLGDISVRSSNSSTIATGPSAGIFLFAPDVDSVVEVRHLSQSGGNANVDVRSGARIRVIEIGATVVNGISGLEYMDTIDVTIATDTVTFGAGGDGVLQRALDGDVDEEYFCSYYMPGDHGGTTLQWVMRPNGVSTAQQCAIDYSGGSSGKITATNLQLADGFVARDTRGTFTLFAKTGRARYYDSTSIVTAPGGGAAEMHQSRNAGTWDEQVTNITSIVFAHTDGALDYILPGAQFILWRRKRAPVRADNAATYERNVEATVAQGTNAAVTYTGGRANFGGSAVGIGIELVDDTVVSGSVDAVLKINGVAVLTATLDSSNTSFARAAAATGVHEILATETVEIDILTTSLVTTGVGTPAVVVNTTLTNNAFILEAAGPGVGPDYIYAQLSANQTTNIAVGNHIEFDTEGSRGSSITLATGAGQANGLFTLVGNKTYKIEASLLAQPNEGFTTAKWRDHSDDSNLNSINGLQMPNLQMQDNVASDTSEMGSMFAIYTAPPGGITIKLELTSTGNLLFWHNDCHVLITEFF